ncbi:hypothetical protein [Botrimarina colliarenosi]|nr:hypothetical protein [Botrimarina colliarenosi]
MANLVAFVALSLAATSGCMALRPGCGCGIAGVCGGAVGCGDVSCGCEPGCAVEPGCGCGTTCGCNGRSMAGQMWCGDCGCDSHKPLINVCTGPDCCGGCEPGCGCAPSCGCGMEAGCGVEPGCGCDVGCGDTCGVGPCGCGNCPIIQNVGFGLKCIGSEVRNLLRPIGTPLGLCCPQGSGCGGCGGCGDLYWNEWHSDPPRCCDPCDDCGNWVGPTGSTSMRAPYDHEFAPRRIATLPGTGTLR